MISVDETQVNRSFKNTYGWSKAGENAANVAYRKGRPVHIAAAVCKDDVIGYMLRYDPIKASSFKFFMMNLYRKLRQMDPINYKERYFFLIDNASAHKVKANKDYIEIQGIPCICNAPMTPHVQPIEFIFSLFKREFSKFRHLSFEDSLIHIFYSFKAITETPAKIYNTYLHTIKAYKDILNYENISQGKRAYKFEIITTELYMKHPANYVALIQMLKHAGKDEVKEDEKPK